MCLLLSASTFAQTAYSQPIQKKLIELGWDKPDAASLRKNLKQMEQSPFNGVIVNVKGTNDKGEAISFYHSFNNAVWKKEYFQNSINDLKAVQSDKLTDNFLQFTANPGNVDWFDDAGWKQIVDHWRIAAEVVKEGGLKGIAFDPEPYVKPHRQFDYAAQPQHDKHSFAEYETRARQRGREVVQAIAAVDPHLVILTTRMLSDVMTAAFSPTPQAALPATGFLNLCPAFVNGWLDAAPPTMIFVEGTEDPGYRANSQFDFLKAGNEMRQNALSLIAPENRQKYKAQVQISFGIYLDAYVNEPSKFYYINPQGETPTERLHQNVSYAADVADEYVWIYGERYRWWPTENKSVKPENWNDAMPGSNEALRSAMDPHSQWLATQQIAALQQKGALVNLVKNGDFSAGTTNTATKTNAPADWKSVGAPANWSTWQTRVSKGTFSQDNAVNHDGSGGGAARLAGISNGCIIQGFKVKPGETYAVRAWLRQTGSSLANIRIRWQDATSKWVSQSKDVMIYPPATTDENWHSLAGTVTVPEDAANLIILLNASGQTSPDDVIWYDDVAAFRLP
jgi:hypothetical protein